MSTVIRSRNRRTAAPTLPELVMRHLRQRKGAGLPGRSLWALGAALGTDGEALRPVLARLEERGLIVQEKAAPSRDRERPAPTWRAL
ncbi:hypothetical protein [Streptomyces spinosisporus]|jgi:hypothetical protein|uniref:MarR family transcriptional regulator n=1 Tax=Streptomyces spinosisporus TaxID=2927582 RepID=A0ABS9X821_9ACTN|nr:hypothetical protein [Streptomyces spinosisporus]MCI3238205.1 hypothetical protein [Streptomyces spinosisporus]